MLPAFLVLLKRNVYMVLNVHGNHKVYQGRSCFTERKNKEEEKGHTEIHGCRTEERRTRNDMPRVVIHHLLVTECDYLTK